MHLTFNNQDIAKENLKEKYEGFLGRMAELTTLFDTIGEKEEQWLLLSAPHVEKPLRSNFFIEYLARYEDAESIARIGRIFKKILEDATPEFPQEYIGRIVRRLYEHGITEDADYICNTYGRRNIHFLKPVWEEFHNL